MTITIPEYTSNITMDDKQTQPLNDFFLLLSELDIATGSGSPEGVLRAGITKRYMDTAGTAGSILYIKRDADIAGDTTQGWILV